VFVARAPAPERPLTFPRLSASRVPARYVGEAMIPPSDPSPDLELFEPEHLP
jgi:hypothetical protein